MWSISSLTNNTPAPQAVNFSDGLPVEAVRGGSGNSFRLLVTGWGFLDLTDTGHQPGGPHYWQLNINGNVYWYDGQGAIGLVLNADGSFAVTGDGNSFGGTLTPLPIVAERDAALLAWMIDEQLVPYQDIPDEPGKTFAQLEALAAQYFPFSPHAILLAMAVYDWTTADFTRIQFLQLFIYTQVPALPLDATSVAQAIWSSNWHTYNPSNADYMNSYMMEPATSLAQVQGQLAQVEPTLREANAAEVALLNAALYSLPRTSCLAKPLLYSGQVDIANLGPQHFATYFLECPLNADPAQPLEMPLAAALATFIQVGRQLTLKGYMSFTDSLADAQHYSNGLVLTVAPPPGAVYWENAAYITPLSDGPDKTEYLFAPLSAFTVTAISPVVIGGVPLTGITLQALN